ncbi:MAG: NHLP bacteriocin export ABC transporter permease/ATPase subunit [Campylobacterota bacterium]|nr:NHLP bacteriocin export ABC transporter permease/ATPase subunit [Campylobacterota bacterium]
MSTSIQINGNNPLQLDNSDKIFYVKKGTINIFITQSQNYLESQREYIHSIKEGEIFFGCDMVQNNMEHIFLAVAGNVNTQIIELSKEDVQQTDIDIFMEKINLYSYPLDDIYSKDEQKEFLLKVLGNYTLQTQERLKLDLDKLNNKIQSDLNDTNDALLNLVSVFDKSINQNILANSNDDELLSVCKIIGKELEIEIKEFPKNLSSQDPIGDISKASNIRVRDINLEHNWYKSDNGTLLGFTNEGVPVVLLQKSNDKYEIINLRTNTTTIANEHTIKNISKNAYMFYKPLPQRKLDYKDIASFMIFNNRKNFFIILSMSIITGIIALATPIATGIIFDSVIPESNKTQLFEIIAGLLVIAFSIAFFNIVRGFTVAKFKGRISLNLQAAIWDRLINMPVSFFRDYSTGELTMRASGIGSIVQMFESGVVSALLGGIFSIFSLILLFSYSTDLALIAFGLVLVAVIFNLGTSLILIRYQKKILIVSEKISGFTFDVLSGIQRIKISGAHSKAYSKWAKQFATQKEIAYRAGTIQNYLEIFNSIFSVLTTVIIFYYIAYHMQDTNSFSIGDYMAFNAAFGQFTSAFLAMSGVVVTILSAKPTYDRLKPILETIPEISTLKNHPGILQGDIEINSLSFKYTQDGPTILNDINMHIKEGEFVAIVGSSGSGKSTLLRLLLGFEEANEGNIYFDSQNLNDIDIRALRSQLGVVLQNSTVLSGDIFTNIVGSGNKTIEDAWKAAKMAGFDEEIRSMPMGMHTMVSDGGGTLSGGQKQRLIISRALINKPNIIFFDEATSALDNKTQRIVTESLDNLNVTRIVIAHRLSTIENADKIYVLENGTIMQCGSFNELMKDEGLFKELAKRQIG